MGKLEQSTVHTGEGSGDIQSRAVAGRGNLPSREFKLEEWRAWYEEVYDRTGAAVTHSRGWEMRPER